MILLVSNQVSCNQSLESLSLISVRVCFIWLCIDLLAPVIERAFLFGIGHHSSMNVCVCTICRDATYTDIEFPVVGQLPVQWPVFKAFNEHTLVLCTGWHLLNANAAPLMCFALHNICKLSNCFTNRYHFYPHTDLIYLYTGSTTGRVHQAHTCGITLCAVQWTKKPLHRFRSRAHILQTAPFCAIVSFSRKCSFSCG